MPKPSRKRPKRQVIQLSLTPLYHKVIRMSIAVYAQKGENNTKFSLPETDRYVKNINDIYGYKIKQGIKVNEDLLELLSIYDKNAKVDTNGNVTVYHRTNADAADFLGKA